MSISRAFQGVLGANQIVLPSASSDFITIPIGNKSVRLVNSGFNICYVRIGKGVQIATTDDIPLQPFNSIVIRKAEDADTVSYLSANGTTLHVQPGEGVSKEKTDRGSTFIISTDFITTWETTNAGVSASDQIQIPTVSGGKYNCNVDWGDGNVEEGFTTFDDARWLHTYTVEGSYTVRVTGIFQGFYFEAGGDAFKLLSISGWGTDFRLGNVNTLASVGHFFGCVNLTITATDLLDLTGVVSLESTFRDCLVLTTIPGIEDWDVSSVIDMGHTFRECIVLTVDLSSWDVSSVTQMNHMLRTCAALSFDISNWDVSSVTAMNNMFRNCNLFNWNISSWDVSSVTNMDGIVRDCSVFNSDLSNWNVSSVTSMNNMIKGCPLFISDLSSWDVSSVLDMTDLFQDCFAFTSNLSSWDVSSVLDMTGMFRGCSVFNSDLSNWNVSSVTQMNHMFRECSLFNSDLSNWNVSSVTVMNNLFRNCFAFTSDLSSWDVSLVTTFLDCFCDCAVFVSDLSSWNVSSAAISLVQMFDGCLLFNSDVSSWDISNVINMNLMFNDTSFDQTNYDLLLDSWILAPPQNGVNFDAGNAQYGAGSPAANRALFISTYSWSISDGGPA